MGAGSATAGDVRASLAAQATSAGTRLTDDIQPGYFDVATGRLAPDFPSSPVTRDWVPLVGRSTGVH